MIRTFRLAVLLGGLLGFFSVTLAQAVYEVEVFEFSTEMGDASVSPVGILEELRGRYKAKGQDLDEADARLVPLDIRISSEMGALTIDLTGLNVRTLNVTSGMADIAVTLPESGATSGDIITDMGNVTLQLPSTRNLAVVESATDMGSVLIDGSVRQEAGGEGAVTLNLQTGMGDINVLPVGAIVEDADMTEDSSEEMSEDVDEASSNPDAAVTVTSVMLSDGTEYFPVMSTDFAGEVLSFSVAGNLELNSERILQELINMNLARDAMIDEATASIIPVKIVLDGTLGNITADLTGLNVMVLELNVGLGSAEVTLPAEGETIATVAVGGGNATLKVPTSRSVILAEGAAGLASITIDDALTASTSNPITLTADVGMGSISVEALQ